MRFVLNPARIADYAPANHAGTANRRIIGPDTVGARHLEVLLGRIAAGGSGLPHAHPGLEQAGIVLKGRALSRLAGVSRELRPGDIDFIPRDTSHAARVVSEEALELLVVYSPPYLEDPSATRSTASDDPLASQDAAHGGVPGVVPRSDAGGAPPARGVEITPIVDGPRCGARHIFIAGVRAGAGASGALEAEAGVERLLVIREGGLSGEIAGEAFLAAEGDWIFVPDGAPMRMQVGAGDLDAILIAGRSEAAAAT